MNLQHEQRKVSVAAVGATIFCTLMAGLGYLVLPGLLQFPIGLPERLVFTLRADLFVFVWVLVGVHLVSRGRYHSAADIGGSGSGPPSPKIAAKVAFLQNTLEQAFMAIGVHLVLATLLPGPAMSLIGVAVFLFGIGRISFYIGYPHGAGGRAFGMVTTVLPTLAGFVLAIVLMVARL